MQELKLLVRNNQVFYIKDVNHKNVPEGLIIEEKVEYEYHNVYKLSVERDVEITRNDGVLETVKEGEKLFLLEVKETVHDISIYLWNYTFYF
jgi:hypothetical protein